VGRARPRTRTRPRTADAILANPLYRNITAKFIHSHDYIAMERLHDIHSSGRYDLIVVDTPPTRNAIDFLDAPSRMADFFSSRLLRWLIAPYRSRCSPRLRNPSTAWPIAYWGAVPTGHRRLLHSLPDHVRRFSRTGRRR
jgi:anion-transporting  ArsA/GET3 family ATPase